VRFVAKFDVVAEVKRIADFTHPNRVWTGTAREPADSVTPGVPSHDLTESWHTVTQADLAGVSDRGRPDRDSALHISQGVVWHDRLEPPGDSRGLVCGELAASHAV
jgi:hypothetical protein